MCTFLVIFSWCNHVLVYFDQINYKINLIAIIAHSNHHHSYLKIKDFNVSSYFTDLRLNRSLKCGIKSILDWFFFRSGLWEYGKCLHWGISNKTKHKSTKVFYWTGFYYSHSLVYNSHSQKIKVSRGEDSAAGVKHHLNLCS